MLNNKVLLGGVILALALPLLFGAYTGGGVVIGPKGDKGDAGELSGASGPTHTNTQYFYSNFQVGRTVRATSTDSATGILTAADFDCDQPYLSWTVNLNTTQTTMASTSAPFSIMRPGEICTIYVYSATTTQATTLTWAAGAGVLLQEDEGETVIQNGLELARFTFMKAANTDILLWIEVGQEG